MPRIDELAFKHLQRNTLANLGHKRSKEEQEEIRKRLEKQRFLDAASKVFEEMENEERSKRNDERR